MKSIFPHHDSIDSAITKSRDGMSDFTSEMAPIVAVIVGSNYHIFVLKNSVFITISISKSNIVAEVAKGSMFNCLIRKSPPRSPRPLNLESNHEIDLVSLIGHVPFAVANFGKSVIMSFKNRPGLLCSARRVGSGRESVLLFTNAE